MNKGWFAPYDHSVRTWMGPWSHRHWTRKQYDLTAPGGAYWTGSAAGLMTTTPPYTIERFPALEENDRQFVYAAYVETIAPGDVHLGFVAEVQSNLFQVYVWDQVWLAGVPQLQVVGQQYVPATWLFWTTFGVGHLLEPGATLGSSPSTYQPVPYPP